MPIAQTRRLRLALVPLALLIAFAPVARAQGAGSKGVTKQMQPADLKAWKNIRQSSLSNDGKWFVYVLAPNEGDATLIIRSTGADAKETKFPIGEAGGGGGGRGGAPGGGSSLTISGDSKWVAFTVYPNAAPAGGRAGRGGRGGAAPAAATPAAPTQNKMALVNLATGEKKEFDKVRSFSFNGDKPTYVAMQSYPEQAAPAADAAAAGDGEVEVAAARARPVVEPRARTWCSIVSRAAKR